MKAEGTPEWGFSLLRPHAMMRQPQRLEAARACEEYNGWAEVSVRYARTSNMEAASYVPVVAGQGREELSQCCGVSSAECLPNSFWVWCCDQRCMMCLVHRGVAADYIPPEIACCVVVTTCAP